MDCLYFYHIYFKEVVIYIYQLECKKGCEFEYIIETDTKDLHKETKPRCPVCGLRIYPDEDKTIDSSKRSKKITKQNKSIEQVIAGQKKARKKRRAVTKK